MNSRGAIAVLLLLSTVPFAACAQQQQAAKPMTKAEIEEIVKQYIMAHPEVVVDSVRQMQAREQAKQKEQSRQALTSKKQELFADPGSQSSKPDEPGQITMVEFFDYRCGYCKKVFPTLQKLQADNAKIRIIYKEFPILGPDSTNASRAALAAAKQGAYVKFHDALMGGSAGPSAERIQQVAKDLGLDTEKLKKDMQSPDIEAAITRNHQLAESIGIEATPTFVIGGELIPGALDEAGFKQYIEKAAKK
jgi:protein-disulfide isomerase